jgi:hypothetical protein
MDTLVENVTQLELFPQEETPTPQQEPNIVIDMEKVAKLEKEYEAKKEELAKKEYVVKMTGELLEYYDNFIANNAQWKGKEALGVMEISKKLNEIKRNGIKNGVTFMSNLHIEASHYFLGKAEGKGMKNLDLYIELYKSIENSLILVGEDNKNLKSLERELHAAQQGLEAE